MNPTVEVSTPLPVYIVGLDDNDAESSLAKSKFRRSIESLSHVYPELGEARATVRAFSKGKERKHFEVHVMIRLPKHQVESRKKDWPTEKDSKTIELRTKSPIQKPRASRPRRRL